MNMMKSLYYSLFLFIGLLNYSYGSFDSVINAKYNSVSTQFSSSQGDIEGDSYGFSGYMEPSEGLLLGYQYVTSDIDEWFGEKFDYLDAETTETSYGFGYIFRNKGFHFIPFVSFGNTDFSMVSFDFFDSDVTRLGATFRVPMSDNSVFNISIENVSVDEYSFTTELKNTLNAQLTAQGDPIYTEEDFEEAENDFNTLLAGSSTVVSFGLDVHYNDHLSVSYDVSTVDFDVTTLSVSAGYNVSYVIILYH